ncbi:hypothetical protein V8C86DRAFT_2764411 [Haematococcus lacustris]
MDTTRAKTATCPLYFLLLLSLPALLCNAAAKNLELIGWAGETYQPQDRVVRHGNSSSSSSHNSGAKQQWVQVLSWEPRAFVYHNFLSDAEAAHIIKLAAPQMKRSTVVGANSRGVVDGVRTSAGTFLRRNQDPIIAAVEQRLAMWSALPPSHQEEMQVLRYGPTNKYGPHLDGLERVASVLIYLVAPEEGGETAFPNSNGWLHPEMGEPTQGPFSDCAKGHVAYKPKRGDALMFYDLKPDYQTTDSNSMHTGCPVVKGVKWNAVKWLHGKPFRGNEYEETLTKPFTPLPDPGVCANLHEMCDTWAAAGECEKNEGYMRGGTSGQGICRLACKECTPCKPSDKECVTANRVAGGYLNFDEAELKLAEMGVAPGTILGHA